MQFKDYAICVLGAAFIVLSIVFLSVPKEESSPSLGGYITGTSLSVATTSSAISVTTSARVLATTSNALGNGTSYTRVHATICNNGSNPVALNLDGDKPANFPSGRVTAWIAAAAGYDACYTIGEDNLYQGSITASSTNQTATIITVKDYVIQ